jgi:MYXO-CTERM domain-containing protein
MARILAPLFLMATPVAASDGGLPGQPWWLALGLAALAAARVARRVPVIARATK